MKKFFCIVFSCLMLISLAACTGRSRPDNTAAPTAANNTQAANTQEAEATAGAERVPDLSCNKETDFDRRLIMNGNDNTVLETDDVYYFLPRMDHFMRWCEKDGSVYGVLCGKPECEHDGGNGEETNTDCNGYLGSMPQRYSWIADGKLYYVEAYGSVHDPESCAKIYRMDLDGTDHEFVRAVPTPNTQYGVNMGVGNFCYHRGILYFTMSCGYIEGAEPSQPFLAAALPLDGEEIKIIHDSGPIMTFFGSIYPIGECCYIFEYGSDRKPNYTKIMRWDSVTEKTSIIYEGDELGIIVRFWIGEDGVIYAASKYEDGVGQKALLRFKDGEWEEVMSFEDAEISYSIRSVSDGIVIARDYRGYESDMDRDIDLWIRKFDGETLYRGKLPMAWIGELEEKYGGHVKFNDSLLFCGNEHELLCVYDTLLPKPAGREYAPQCRVLVRYDITDEGLSEVRLCEAREWIIEDYFG